MLQERGFWKLNFRIGWRGFWTRGLRPGVYVRQSWNLAFKSAMCDSVGFIRPCHWTGDSDLGGFCPVTDNNISLLTVISQREPGILLTYLFWKFVDWLIVWLFVGILTGYWSRYRLVPVSITLWRGTTTGSLCKARTHWLSAGVRFLELGDSEKVISIFTRYWRNKQNLVTAWACVYLQRVKQSTILKGPDLPKLLRLI